MAPFIWTGRPPAHAPWKGASSVRAESEANRRQVLVARRPLPFNIERPRLPWGMAQVLRALIAIPQAALGLVSAWLRCW